MIGWWLLWGFSLLVALVCDFYLSFAAWPLLLVLFALAAVSIVLRQAYLYLAVRYQLTDQRLITRVGISMRTSDRLELLDVEDVVVEGDLCLRIFNYGTIRVTSHDRSSLEMKLAAVRNPRDVAHTINDAVRKIKSERSFHVQTTP